MLASLALGVWVRPPVWLLRLCHGPPRELGAERVSEFAGRMGIISVGAWHVVGVGSTARRPFGFERVLGDGSSPFSAPDPRRHSSAHPSFAFELFGSFLFVRIAIMSLLAHPLADDAAEQAIGTMSSELVYLLESAQVPRDIIAKLGELGYTDMDTFSHMEVNPRGVRTILKDDVGLDPAGGAGHRS